MCAHVRYRVAVLTKYTTRRSWGFRPKVLHYSALLFATHHTLPKLLEAVEESTFSGFGPFGPSVVQPVPVGEFEGFCHDAAFSASSRCTSALCAGHSLNSVQNGIRSPCTVTK